MAPAETAPCFVLLSSNSSEKQPTPSPCQHPLTSRSPGLGLCPTHCAALLLGLPHLDWPIMLQTPCPAPVGGRVWVDAGPVTGQSWGGAVAQSWDRRGGLDVKIPEAM